MFISTCSIVDENVFVNHHFDKRGNYNFDSSMDHDNWRDYSISKENSVMICIERQRQMIWKQILPLHLHTITQS